MPSTPFPVFHDFLEVEKLQNSDVESFRFLYQRFNHELLNEAREILIVPAEAPSIVKRCFVSCWMQSQIFSSINYTLGFLLSAVIKECNEFNKGNKYQHQEQIMNLILSGSILDRKDHDHLLIYIMCLSPTEYKEVKQAFSLNYRRQLPVNEIAIQMNLSPEVAQDKLNQAFKMLHLIFVL